MYFFDNINSEMRKIETKNRKIQLLKNRFYFFCSEQKIYFYLYYFRGELYSKEIYL